MKINNIIKKIKNYYSGIGFDGKPIDENKTRDKILFGNDYADIECTGIVTSCWPSVFVIEEAIKKGANLIICHEALFWNHGDKTEWLEADNNETFFEKRNLLKDNQIVVWRNHDYIHSGFPLENQGYVDGIFYGLAQKLGWENNIVEIENSRHFQLPKQDLKGIVKKCISELNLNGAKVIGNIDMEVQNIFICDHVMGERDSDTISLIDRGNYDLIIALELIDFTVTEYIHDRSKLNSDIAILTLGHFNTEEPGMEYMLEYLEEAIGERVDAHFVQSGDMYQYFIK